jgi:hypothetical protein
LRPTRRTRWPLPRPLRMDAVTGEELETSDGRRWATYDRVHELTVVPTKTLSAWVARGHIETVRLDGQIWLNLDQAQDRERTWRRDKRRTTPLPEDPTGES